ncbi:MAG: response regulator [Magnetococcales bacterium]|nr:response regulator [Magnetococcales bacterium]
MAKIVIVDDEHENCLVMDGILKHCTHKHITKYCCSGADAVSLVASWKPDLVFMDISMPVMDGFTAIENIRRQGYTGKIIIVTADHRSENARHAAKSGANGFLAKPVDIKSVCSIVDQFVPI